jgi:hypothetical protein
VTTLLLLVVSLSPLRATRTDVDLTVTMT